MCPRRAWLLKRPGAWERSAPLTSVRCGLAATVIAIVGAATLLAVPTTATAGTLAVVSCKTAAGSPAPTEGWEVGWTGTPFAFAGNNNECVSGGPLVSYIGDQEPQPGSSGPVWQYTPPTGYKIVGGFVTASFTVPGGGGNYGGAAGLLGPKLLFDGADVIGGTNGGNAEATYSLAGHTGGDLWIYAFCEPPGSTCPAGDSNAWYWALAYINSATIELNDANTPQASNFSGSLLNGTASGTAHLDFAASEAAPGPGIYSVTVDVDGKALYAATPDGNGGRCVSVGHDSNGIAEFLYPQPCPLTEQVDLPIDTTGLADGRHDLQVTITDAAGVTAVVYDGTITTANRTTVSALLNSPLATSTLTGQPIYSMILDKHTAALTERLARSFDASALTLSGELRNSVGVPVPGVTMWLTAQQGNTPQGAPVVLDHATTNAAGAWLLHARKGPSRLLSIVYGDTASAQNGVAIKETVRPSLGLRVDTPGGRRIVFGGRLAISPLDSPRPLIIIETLAGRTWQAVGNPVRVKPNGSYRYVYNSSPLTVGRRFAFRATTPETNLWQAATSPARWAVVH